MNELYESDVLEWSEYQVKILRKYATGCFAGEAPDWTNIIKELESVGRSRLSAVQSLLVQALFYDLKAQAWPQSSDVLNWRVEGRHCRANAVKAWTYSMVHRIDLSELYANALERLPTSVEGQVALPVPNTWHEALEQGLGYFKVVTS